MPVQRVTATEFADVFASALVPVAALLVLYTLYTPKVRLRQENKCFFRLLPLVVLIFRNRVFQMFAFKQNLLPAHAVFKKYTIDSTAGL